MSFAQVPDAPDAVFVIWIVTLAIAVLVILPLTVYLLQRTLNAARNIERYMGEMRDAGAGIAANTRYVGELDETIEVATQILETAGAIGEHSAALEATLAARASDNGQQQTSASG